MNNIAAIELGSEKIACAVASVEPSSGKIRIIGFASVPSRGIKRAHIIDIHEATKSLEQCLQAAERMAGTRINHAILLVNGPNIASQTSHGIVAVNYQNKEIHDDDVTRAIESAKAISLGANREVIHVLPKEFIVDGQGGIKNPVGMSGVRLEVNTHIITASSITLNNLQKTCSLLGVEIDSFIFTGLASSQAVLNETERELGCVVADIGGGTTSLCVFTDRALVYTSVIPLGSKNVTSDIAAGLKVSLASAEAIKLHLSQQSPSPLHRHAKKRDELESDELDLTKLNLPEGLESISKKILVQGIIKPRLEEIAEYIRKELTASGAYDQIPSGLIITGGGAQTPYIEEILQKELGMGVQMHTPMQLEGLADELRDPRYASLVGALLYTAEAKEDKQQFSMPEFGQVFKNIDLKNTVSKTMDFLKSFIPGAK